jgi:hypothetical protein
MICGFGKTVTEHNVNVWCLDLVWQSTPMADELLSATGCRKDDVARSSMRRQEVKANPSRVNYGTSNESQAPRRQQYRCDVMG